MPSPRMPDRAKPSRFRCAAFALLVALLLLEPAPGSGAPIEMDPIEGRSGLASPLEQAQQAGDPGLPVAGGYRLARSYQSSPEVPLGVIEDPSGITVADDGTVFVTDRALHRVQRFESDGTPLMAYGSPGDGPGDLYQPSGVAVDLQRDRVYIGDTENDRVAIFKLDGSFEANWGPYEAPEGIAVGPSGLVYIYEGDTGAIRVRDTDGTGDGLITPGAYIDREAGVAGGMAAAPDGHLCVAMNLGVRRYPPEGGEADGQCAQRLYPTGAPYTKGVSFDDRGRIYVLERDRIRYEWSGGLSLPVGISIDVRAMAAGEAGTLYMIVPKSRDLPAGVVVRHFENGRQTDVRRWGIPQTVLGWLKQPLRLVLGSGDDLFVVDDLRRAQRFGSDLQGAEGQVVMPGMLEIAPIDANSLVVARTRFGSSGDDPEDEDAAPAGQQVARVERYDLPGALGPEPPAFEDLGAAWRHERFDEIVASDASRVLGMDRARAGGPTWVLDAGRSSLTAYADDGSVAGSIPLEDRKAGFPAWSDVAIDPRGNLLALHTAERKLHRFAPDGSQLPSLELPEYAWRVAVGPAGEIFLPTARRWVWRLNEAGGVEAFWPLPEPAYGDPQPPSDLAVGDDGTVYLLDQTSSAIYAFEPDGGPRTEARPDPGRLSCQIDAEAAFEPESVEMGQPTTMELRIGGDCDPHQRTGHQPSLLLRSAEISLTLPAGVELVAGSVEPPAEVDGDILRWQLSDLPPVGGSLRLQLTSSAPGRFEFPLAGGLRYLDGWFEFGQASITPAFFYTLIPPTPTPAPTATPAPSLHLPWLKTER